MAPLDPSQQPVLAREDLQPRRISAVLDALQAAQAAAPRGYWLSSHEPDLRELESCALDRALTQAELTIRRPGDYEHELVLFLPRGAGAAQVDCPCPKFGQTGFCPHAWAALGYLSGFLSGELDLSQLQLPRSLPPEWLRGLSRLDAILEESGAAPRASESDPRPAESPQRLARLKRLEWRIGLDEVHGEVWIQAWEARPHQRGSGFTKPARIRFEQLIGTRDHDLLPSDQAVIRLIDELSEPGYFRQGGRPHAVLSKFDIDPGLALPALIGAPNVRWAEAPQLPLALVSGELGLRLSETPDGGLTLSTSFDGEVVQGRWALEDELLVIAPQEKPGAQPPDSQQLERAEGDPEPAPPRRLCLAHGRRAARLIAAELLAAPQVIPPEGRDALGARLLELEKLLPVSVPPGLRSSGPSAADGRLRLLLSLEEEVLSVRARVRPCGDAVLRLPGDGEAEFVRWEGGRRRVYARERTQEAARARALLDELGLREADEHFAWDWRLPFAAGLELVTALQPPPGDPPLIVEWPEGAQILTATSAGPGALRVQIEDGADWFQIRGGLSVEGWEIPLGEVLPRLRGDGFIALDDGRWLRLSRQLRERLEALEEGIHVHGKRLEVDASSAPWVERALQDAGEVEVDRGWLELRARLARAENVTTRLPPGLEAELRPYQREGYVWLRRLATWGAGACLADDMGLGKTIQAIALLLARAQEPDPPGPALVLAPTSVGFNWVRELERFAPGLEPILWRETARQEETVAACGPRAVVIASYDLARIDAEVLVSRPWGTLILDEAQQVKNSQTKTARALQQIRAGWRLALTGTPLENHTGELWGLFRLISPGVFGSWKSFRRRYAVPIEREGDPAARAALARRIRPFVLRRTKAEVLHDLPARTEVQLDIELSPRERRLYDEARLAAILALGKADEQDRFRVLAALTRLRQQACHPGLVDGSWNEGSAKLDAFLELADELRANGHRALVFSQFTRHLALIRAALEARGVTPLYLDGSTPAAARRALVDRFQGGEGEFFLISLKAGGTGLNLTGADHVVHLDPWWNPAVEDQASDRAHRIGQRRPVTIYRLVASGTIEDEIVALHARKRDLVAGILSGASQAGKLSAQELVGLIRGRPSSELDAPLPLPEARPTIRRSVPQPQEEPASGASPLPAAPAAPSLPTALGSLEPRELARRLLTLRRSLQLSQTQMGLLFGVKAGSIARWERGKASLPPTREARLLELLTLTPSALFTRLEALEQVGWR